MLRFDDQSLLQNCPTFAKRSDCPYGIAFCPRNHRLEPGLWIIEAEIDVLKVFPRRSSKDSLGLGVVAVEHCHPDAVRRLSAGKFHVRKFCENIAEWSGVAGSVQPVCGASEPDDWDLLAGSKHVVRDVNRFRKSALERVRVAQKIVGIRISRIERERGGEISFGDGKMVAASIDVAGENEERRAVR